MAITTVREAELANYRDYVIGLMRKAELPTRTVTVMHRNLFAHAEVPWRDGDSMDAALSALHLGQLIALKRHLLALIDIEDDDEEEDA